MQKEELFGKSLNFWKKQQRLRFSKQTPQL